MNTKAKIFADADHNGAGARVLVSQPSSYTPGPWRVDESAMKVRASNGLTVAEPFTKADAFLIAAAPELLAALERAQVLTENASLAGYDPFNALREIGNVVRAVIAKAEGRS